MPRYQGSGGRETVDFKHCIVPGYDAVHHVPFPYPNLGDRGGQRQAFSQQYRFGLSFPALGDVPRTLAKAEELAGSVPQSGEDYTGPEAGPVLAYAPAFLLQPPLLRRRLQLHGGETGCHIFHV